MDRHTLKIFRLPALLVALLVVETILFNIWLGIFSAQFLLRCMAATIGLGTLIFLPAVFLPRRVTRYLYLFAVSLVVAAIFVSQYLYFKYSGGFLQGSSLGYASQSANVMSTVFTLLSAALLVFAAPLALIASFYAFDVNGGLKFKQKLAALGFISLLLIGGYGYFLLEEQLTFGSLGALYETNDMFNLSSLVSRAGIVNFYLDSLAQFALAPHTANAADLTFLGKWAASRTPAPKGADFGLAKGRDLIFIQVESLENWVIGYKLNGTLVAPNLTALAAQGVYFPNYYSQDAEGNTADAEFSTLNSLYPLPDTVAFVSKAKNTYDALPQLLDENGYTTAAMHGDVATFWNRANMYPSLGYERIVAKPDYTIPERVGPEGLGDADFFAQSLPKLEALPQPFMATLITLSTHTPFTIPAALQTLTIPPNSGLTPTQQDYLEAVHYADQSLGEFITGLKADGLYDRSVIAIYGDHGAFIGTSDSKNQHVPLILLAPGKLAPKVDQTPGSHLDLYPTVASLLGIEPPITALGQDLLSTKTPVVTQRVPGTGAIKFIVSANLKYTGSVDNTFAHGTCTTFPGLAPLPVSDCQALYDAQVANAKASDLAVRFNLLSGLKPQ